MDKKINKTILHCVKCWFTGKWNQEFIDILEDDIYSIIPTKFTCLNGNIPLLLITLKNNQSFYITKYYNKEIIDVYE